MGQKVSPHGLRVGVIKDWDSKWYADKTKFADYLIEDNKVRDRDVYKRHELFTCIRIPENSSSRGLIRD